MKLCQRIFLSTFVGGALTLASLVYEFSYKYCYKEICYTRPAWGFPFAYVFDGEGSSPAMSMNIEDDLSPFLFLLNAIIYSSVVFLVLHSLSNLRRKNSDAID